MANRLWDPVLSLSAIPESYTFLFKVQTLIVKFLSCAFAVGCGMPVGYEGPMIHLGSLVAAGMSQFKSATFECSLPCFSRFRNSEDRRNFISAGAAAGTDATRACLPLAESGGLPCMTSTLEGSRQSEGGCVNYKVKSSWNAGGVGWGENDVIF